MLKQQFQGALTDFFPLFTGVGQKQYDNVGDVRVESGGSGQAVYKFVQTTGTLAFVAGDFLSYTSATLLLADATNSVFPAGVAQFANPGGSVLLGWVQIQGFVTLNTAFAATTAGFALKSAGAPNKTLVVCGLVTDYQVGYAVNATTQAVLKLPIG
jgi:hypothetical protein